MSSRYGTNQFYDTLLLLPRYEGRWLEIRENIAKLSLSELENSEACWDMLCESRISDAIWRYYDPTEKDEMVLELAFALDRNLRGLFATNRACALMERAPESAMKWLSRAICSLDPTARATSSAFDGTASSTSHAIASALASYRARGNTVATAHVWCHWWLGLIPRPGSEASRCTPIAWMGIHRAEAGELYVFDTGLEYPAIAPHPQSALLPVRPSWLDAAERARQDAASGTSPRTTAWLLTEVGDPPILKGSSIYGSFFSALSALVERSDCELTHAVLACPGTPEGFSQVFHFSDKLQALAKRSVTHVAKAEDQPPCAAPHGLDASTTVTTREQVLEFISGESTQLRALIEAVRRVVQPYDSRKEHAPFIEPVLRHEAVGSATKTTFMDESNRRMAPWQAWVANLLDGQKGLDTVIAASGFGKTRLVREVIIQAADSSRSRSTTSDILPILALTGQDMEQALEGAQHGFGQSDAETIIVTAATTRFPEHRGKIAAIVHRASNGHGRKPLLLVVDGLDAMPHRLLDKAIRLIEACAKWNCRLLLTGKPQTIPHQLRSLGEAWRIEELTPRRARRLVRSLLSDAPAAAERLLRRLNSDPSLARLARVPFLCEILCDTARETDVTAQTRTTICREFILARLYNPRDPRGAAERLSALGHVGRMWLEAMGTDAKVSVGQFDAWFREGGRNVLPYAPAQVLGALGLSAFSEWLRREFEEAGLFHQSTNNSGLMIGPAHSVILEYLAGVGIANRFDASSATTYSSFACDTSRRDCLAYVAGSLPAPALLIENLMNAVDPLHLSTLAAAECLAEADLAIKKDSPGVPLELAETICTRLAALLGSPARAAHDRAFRALSLVGLQHPELVHRVITKSDANEGIKISLRTAIGGAAEIRAALSAVQDRKLPAADRASILAGLAGFDDSEVVETAAGLLRTPGLRVAAAELLAQCDTPEAVEALVSLAVDSDGVAREIFADAIALTDGQDIVRHITELLNNERDRVRESAVEVLMAVGVENLAETLAGVAMDPAGNVRRAVATALGLDRNDLAINLLGKLAEDGDYIVRRAAVRSLKRCGAPAHQLLLARIEDPDGPTRLLALEALASMGAQVDFHQLEIAIDGDVDEMRIAARMLGQLDAPAASEALSRRIYSEDGSPNLFVMLELGRVGGERAIEILARAATSSSTIEREYAAIALGETGNPAAIHFMLPLLEKPNDSRVREAAVRGIGRLRDRKAVPFLVNCILSRDEKMADAAASALAESANSQDIYYALRKAASDGSGDLMWGDHPEIFYDLLTSAHGLSDLLRTNTTAADHLDSLARIIAKQFRPGTTIS